MHVPVCVGQLLSDGLLSRSSRVGPARRAAPAGSPHRQSVLSHFFPVVLNSDYSPFLLRCIAQPASPYL